MESGRRNRGFDEGDTWTMKSYPSYKNSGVEWIGEIPREWGLNKVSRNTYVKGRIGWKGLKSDDFLDEGPFLITGTDFKDGKINWNKTYHVSEERYEEDPFIIVQEGDVLITKDGTIGKIVFVDKLLGPTTLNSGIFVTRPLKKEYYSLYFYWLLNSSVFKTFVDYRSHGSTIQHLYQNVFEDFKFPIPLLPEQQQISNYLDQKTKQIDDLIKKTQQKIELLKEKRTSLINHCVTKGIDLNVEMKDSGVEWIGKIPKDWVISKIKYLSEMISKGTTPSTIDKEVFDEGKIRFIKCENISNDRISDTPKFFIDEETNKILKRSQLRSNDILFVIAGATTGKSVILDSKFIPANTNQAVCFIRLKEKENPVFVNYWFKSDLIKNKIFEDIVQSAQPNLSMEDLGNFSIPYPNHVEQKQIVFHLDKETQKIDTLIEKENKRTDLLKEYRQSLISEVVTGKIDVRNEVLQ
jgi:type I restriction enzyme, S subunit